MNKKVLGVEVVEKKWMPKTKAMFVNNGQVVIIEGLPHPNPIIRLSQRLARTFRKLIGRIKNALGNQRRV
jgi:hypothetical protein